jgi:hypothetical protein
MSNHRAKVAAPAFFVILLLLILPAGAVGAAGSEPGGTMRAAALPLANGYWTKTVNGPVGANDQANGVSCDQRGDAIVVGSIDTGPGAAGIIIWVRKYSGKDGSTIWTRTQDSPVPGPGDASALGVSCDSNGDPVVAGHVWNGVTLDTWVRKYDGTDGSTLWTKTFNGGGDDEAYSVSCDPAGNPVVAGFSSNGANPDIWVRKYDGSDGSTLWTKTFNGGSADIAYAVSCDGLGNPVVCGYTWGATSNIWVRKYDGSDGSTLWTKTYDGGSLDTAHSVSCDGDGNPVVAGVTFTGVATSLVWVRKYDGTDGSTLWTRTADAGWHTNGAFGVCCDSVGDAVVTGYFRNAAGNRDIGVAKYNGSDGGTRWNQAFAGPGNGYDTGLGVSIDFDGNPFVVGSITNAAGNDDIWVRKYPPGQYASTAWYLAEGSTAWGFDEYISIENPNVMTVHTPITYITSTGPVVGPTLTLPPSSQATVNPRDMVGAADFSTKVLCTEGRDIAVDRTMSWTGTGAASPEGHNSIGVTFPSKTWYLAEGSSSWGFECWLLIQNPNAQAADCRVTYMIEGAPPQTVTKTVPPNSRRTYNIADDIGSHDASIRVTANVPVIPERAMYRNNRREGHDSIGTKVPASDYFLAEGTTAWGFTTYVLVQNPNDEPADVTVTYMTPTGSVQQAPFTMPANSRHTIRVNDIPAVSNTDLSTRVHGSLPIIAERAMYWGAGTPLGEATHDSIGMASPHTTFWLPDGQTSDGRETWTLVQNPNTDPVNVTIGYLTPTGVGNVVFNDTIPANSRKTYNMADKGIMGRAAVRVLCTSAGKKIMVERAMYWNSRGAGTDTIGGFTD